MDLMTDEELIFLFSQQVDEKLAVYYADRFGNRGKKDILNIMAQESKTYLDVLNHRRKCNKWGKSFCLSCFGGGLTQFIKDLRNEIHLSTSHSEGTELPFQSNKKHNEIAD